MTTDTKFCSTSMMNRAALKKFIETETLREAQLREKMAKSKGSKRADMGEALAVVTEELALYKAELVLDNAAEREVLALCHAQPKPAVWCLRTLPLGECAVVNDGQMASPSVVEGQDWRDVLVKLQAKVASLAELKAAVAPFGPSKALEGAVAVAAPAKKERRLKVVDEAPKAAPVAAPAVVAPVIPSIAPKASPPRTTKTNAGPTDILLVSGLRAVLRSFEGVADSVRLEAGPFGLRLSATESGVDRVEVTLSQTVGEAFDVVVSTEWLLAAMKGARSLGLAVESATDGRLKLQVLRGGASAASMLGTKPDGLWRLAEDAKGNLLHQEQVPSAAFYDAVAFALSATSTDITRETLNGVGLIGRQVVGTDGHRLNVARLPMEGELVGASCFLSNGVASAFLTLLDETEVTNDPKHHMQLAQYAGATVLTAGGEGVTLRATAAASSGTFPEYQRVMPKPTTEDTVLLMTAGEVMVACAEAAERSAMAYRAGRAEAKATGSNSWEDAEVPTVGFSYDAVQFGQLRVNQKTEAKVQGTSKLESAKWLMTMQAAYVADAVRWFPAEAPLQIRFVGYGENDAPVTITTDSDSTRTVVVMPMRGGQDARTPRVEKVEAAPAVPLAKPARAKRAKATKAVEVKQA